MARGKRKPKEVEPTPEASLIVAAAIDVAGTVAPIEMPKRKSKKRSKAKCASPCEIASAVDTTMAKLAADFEADLVANEEVAPIAVGESAFLLPDCMDSAAAVDLCERLLSARGKAISIDASQVRRVGAQSLQVLISAARTWQMDGHAFEITEPSSELLDTIALAGLAREELHL